MATNQIQFGQGVYSRDGEKLGSVDHLVLNTENNHLESLVVRQGVLAGDKLVDIDLIEQVQDDRVVLSLPADETEQLPDFVEERFVLAPSDVSVEQPFIVPAAGMGGGSLFYPVATTAFVTESASLYEPASPNPPPIEDRSNIPPEDVMIGQGTDVVGADGHKVGTVDEVMFDEHGRTAGFVIKEGLIFKHRLRVPMDWVESAGEDEIRLNVPSDVVGSEGQLRGF
jgi:uncharacterized protein YrrD